MMEDQGDWTEKVKAVLERAKSASHRTPETQVARAFQRYETHAGLPVLEQTPKARAQREIHRIAMTYSWHSAVARALDTAGAGTMDGLDDDQLEQLVERMRAYVDQAMTACDFDEGAPAR